MEDKTTCLSHLFQACATLPEASVDLCICVPTILRKISNPRKETRGYKTRAEYLDRDPAARLAGWEQVSTLDDEEVSLRRAQSVFTGANASSNTTQSPPKSIPQAISVVPPTRLQTARKSPHEAEKLSSNQSARICCSAKRGPETHEWVPLKKITDVTAPISAIARIPNGSSYLLNAIPEKDEFSAVECASVLRIPIVGSRHSGKTSLVRQFVHCADVVNPTPTLTRPEYYDRVITFNDRLFNLRMIDCPSIMGRYPTTSAEEWSHYRGWGLRSASAFVLVFDITSDQSFQYTRHLRDQIVSEHADIPVLLVANKIDKLHITEPNSCATHCSPQSTAPTALTTLAGTDSLSRHTISNLRREVAALVKKQWKGTVLVECSARYNWHVVTVFKELMKLLETKEQSHKPTAARAVQNVLRRNQCSVM
ncbi:GTP-binding domain protein [Opisthorchis viverrini]|uniref:GTP-binding domain protein n=1 Tax=Opisthorchis viverrini TaxID=6198 RepID=A0A1S8XA17_OPIVI|nr:GTP-binding domain protein [Opisthorchis viverrini]